VTNRRINRAAIGPTVTAERMSQNVQNKKLCPHKFRTKVDYSETSVQGGTQKVKNICFTYRYLLNIGFGND